MANFNINKTIQGGHLTADPELKTTANGIAVTGFTVAVTRRGKVEDGQKPQADFINCVAWRERAELICKYFRKGSSICVVGQIQTRTYDDKDGNKRYVTEVLVDEVMFVDSKADSQAQQTQAPAQTQAQTTPDAKFEELSLDEDLPF